MHTWTPRAGLDQSRISEQRTLGNGLPFKALAAPTLPLDQIFLYPKPHCRRRRLTQGARADDARRAFLADASARAAFWAALGLPVPAPDATVVSLFSYENAALEPLLTAWRAATAPV